MARGSQAATTAATSAQNLSNTNAGNSSALYGALAPQLESQLAHPTGLNPNQKAEMTTDQLQTAGGSTAGAVGQGALKAARTRNAGGSDAAIQQSARQGGVTASQGALKTDLADTNLQQHNKDLALSGLEGLYGTSTGAATGALGQVANNVNANTQAENASWDWTKGVDAVSGVINAGTGFIPKG